MAGPTFLVLGAAKAGTSSLFRYLEQHPDVYGVPSKETNYFALGGRPPSFRGPGDDRYINRHSVWRPEDYSALYEPARTKAAGEASPLYLYDAGTPARVARCHPDARLVIVLRHPVERAYASWLHMRRDGREPCQSFEEALAEEERRIAAGWEFLWHYRAVSRYGEQLERWLAHFDRAQLGVWLYEDLARDPASVTSQVLAHIGVDRPAPLDTTHHYNRSGVPRSRVLQRLLGSDHPARRVAGRLLPERARRRVRHAVNRANLRRPALDPATRRSLADDFADDVAAVERLLGRDLSAWRA